MSDLILLSTAQMRRIGPYFPLSHGVPRVDDQLTYWMIMNLVGRAYTSGNGRTAECLLIENHR